MYVYIYLVSCDAPWKVTAASIQLAISVSVIKILTVWLTLTCSGIAEDSWSNEVYSNTVATSGAHEHAHVKYCK